MTSSCSLRLPFVTILVVCLASCAAQTAITPSIANPMLGRTAQLSLTTAQGVAVEIPVPGARVTLVEFWVTYCKACGRSLPKMQALTPELREEGIGVVLVAVLYDEQPLEEVQSILRRWGVNAEFVVDRGGHFWRRFHIPVPGFAVIDSEGVVRWVGPATCSETRAAEVARSFASP